MGQESAMLHAFVFVNACVLAVFIGLYLRIQWDLRRARRATPVDAEEVEHLTLACKIFKSGLWLVACVLGLVMLIARW